MDLLDYGITWLLGSVLCAVWFAWLCHTAPLDEDLARVDRELDSEADERHEWEAAEADRAYEMGRE